MRTFIPAVSVPKGLISAIGEMCPHFNEGRMNLSLDALLKIARVKQYWMPSYLARVVWGVLTNFPTQIHIFNVLNNSTYAAIVSDDLRFPFRYLAKNYLSRNLTAAERASSFFHHYSRLNSLLPIRLLRQILQRDLTLLEKEGPRSDYRVAMCLSRASTEGELSLNLEVNGSVVFVLSFTIIPGQVVGLEDRDVLMVSRIQGRRGRQREIYELTKALHEVAPCALLVAALQGVAKALGIASLAGVCATDQAYYQEVHSTFFEQAYDDFWVELGAIKNAANVFVCSLPASEKPLVLVRNGHKSRTRKKRKFKQDIAESVFQRLREECPMNPTDSILTFPAGDNFSSYLAVIPGHAVDSPPLN